MASHSKFIRVKFEIQAWSTAVYGRTQAVNFGTGTMFGTKPTVINRSNLLRSKFSIGLILELDTPLLTQNYFWDLDNPKCSIQSNALGKCFKVLGLSKSREIVYEFDHDENWSCRRWNC